ncbi:MAG: S9 family peptidase [Alistipes sp.]|nr:S9 family peptidase [Alistipes sp.]
MKKLLAIMALLFCAENMQAQSAAERAADLFDDYARWRRVPAMTAVRPAADGEHFYVVDRGGIVRMSYADPEERTGMLPVSAGSPSIAGFEFSADGSLLVADGSTPIYRHSFTTDYLLCRDGRTERIAPEVEGKRDASFSPDGRMIAFSAGNDLWLYDIESSATRRLTDDGEWNSVINGTTDWVYEEEFGFTRAYAFSPDSRRIAYLRFDESRVPEFEMMRFDGTLYNRAYSFKYPKAGDANSTVTLHVYDTASGLTREVSVDSGRDQYIPHICWTPGGELCFFRVDRRQRCFEVILDRGGEQLTVYREESPRYVERPSGDVVQWLDDDRFIVREETSAGWWHLYLYSVAKGRLRALTQGEWEVTQVVAVSDRYVWYMSTEASPLRRDLYRIDLRGKGKRRLTGGDGWYAVQPGAGMKYYVESFSSSTLPGRISVHTGDGAAVRTIAEATDAADAPRREFFTWTTERGDSLNAYVVYPRGFDPAKRYPVLLTQYSGPGSQEVADRWRYDWCDALTEAGFIVAATDGRGTGFRGESFKKQTYGDLGHLETEDQISFARHWAAQPFVDEERIGIYGWSYGGFMALSCALKGDGLFRMAIAVAPVTSWRFYDSIYTETYNGLPSENAAGYDDNSPLDFADRLSPRTRLLMVHGTADDNVHFQNSMEMARRLNACGAQYDMMVYPDQNHSMMPSDTGNVRRKMLAYVLENL